MLLNILWLFGYLSGVCVAPVVLFPLGRNSVSATRTYSKTELFLL